MDNQKPQFKHPEFKYRGHINEELAGRYGWLISDLEKTVKDDAAAAHRTATQLRNTCERFERALSDEQKLALRAAAGSMGRLARELEELKPWAKSKVAHKKSEWAAREKFDQETYAEERWHGDEGAMMAELGHAKAFLDGEGKAWLEEKYQVNRAVVSGRDTDQLHRLKPESTADEIRSALVKFLHGLRESESETRFSSYGRAEGEPTRWAGWHDYCLFLAARNGADATVRAVLGRLTVEGGVQ